MKTAAQFHSFCLFSLRIVIGFLGLCTVAAADGDRVAGKFYFAASLGPSFIEDTTLKSSDLFLQGGQVQFRPGGRADFGFGYCINEWLAAELETGLVINSTDSIGNNSGSGKGLGFYQIPLTANVVCSIPTHSRLNPFLGVGVGGEETQLEDSDWLEGRSDGDFGFAWQGFAGLRFQFNTRLELGLVYKYLATTQRYYGTFDATMEGTHTHSVSFSMSLKF